MDEPETELCCAFKLKHSLENNNVWGYHVHVLYAWYCTLTHVTEKQNVPTISVIDDLTQVLFAMMPLTVSYYEVTFLHQVQKWTIEYPDLHYVQVLSSMPGQVCGNFWTYLDLL